jgi:hypothetical protein
VRKVLIEFPELGKAMLDLAEQCHALQEWSRDAAPVLGEEFRVEELSGQPGILAEESARGWLRGHGAPVEKLSGDVVRQLVRMATDAATGARRHFPGRIMVGRRGGVMRVVG